jgi:PAS domain S-box-containing protein
MGLGEAEQHLRLFLDAQRDYAVVMLDPEGTIVSWNKAAKLIKGYDARQILGRHFSVFYSPEDVHAGKPERALKTAAARGRFHDVSVRLRKDGTRFAAEVVIAPILGKRGKLLGFGKIVRDVTSRVAAEAQEKATRERLRSLLDTVLDTLVDALIVIDKRGRIQAFNRSAERLFGYRRHEMVGKNVKVLTPPEIRAEHDTYIRNYQTTGVAKIIGISREVVGQRKDGSQFRLHLAVGEALYDGEPVYVGVLRDLTERDLVDEQLRQAQKMEAVGQLTGGIAHDFNNILMIVMNNAEALLEEGDVGASVRTRIEQIEKAAQRAADLTRQLLAYSRRQPLKPALSNLNDIIASTGTLLQRSLGDDVEFRTILGDRLWTVSIDRAQFQSLLVNLSLNARDAMPSGGSLTVETRNIILDPDYVALNPGAVAGPHVTLAVSDSGVGIPAESLPRVFEPFYTTKPVGKGTGLGLSMVYGFVKQSGGHIKIYSEIGKGTTVRVYLPTRDEAAEAMDGEAGLPMLRGHERVLLVEDDEQVRAGLVQQLSSLGYSVEAATDGAAGLATFEGARVPYDLLLTDVVMPGPVGGKLLAEEVLRQRPDMPIIFMSGYTEDSVIRQGRLNPGVQLLSKPFRKRELATAVREALDRASRK